MIVFEDGDLIKNITQDTVWDGQFSKVHRDGSLIKFIKSSLPKNTIFVIPRSDGNINISKKDNEYSDVDWKTIQPYIDDAKEKNKVFILGTLCQVSKEPDINYLYLPLDDTFFENGIINSFPENTLPWKERSSDLCWRGGCSGVGGLESLRVRFVKKLYDYPNSEKVRLSTWWSENKNIPSQYFHNRIHYTEFMKYKIFFIVDGNVIASNHMWGFATGCVPFLISNGICWFSSFIVPYVHYIPVNHDLSNLIEQIEFVKNNDEKAEQIAKNALEFSKKYFSKEFQEDYIKSSIRDFIKPDY